MRFFWFVVSVVLFGCGGELPARETPNTTVSAVDAGLPEVVMPVETCSGFRVVVNYDLGFEGLAAAAHLRQVDRYMTAEYFPLPYSGIRTVCVELYGFTRYHTVQSTAEAIQAIEAVGYVVEDVGVLLALVAQHPEALEPFSDVYGSPEVLPGHGSCLPGVTSRLVFSAFCRYGRFNSFEQFVVSKK